MLSNFLNFFEFLNTIFPSFFLFIFPLSSNISLEKAKINSSFLLSKASCPMISASIYNAFNSFASSLEKELLPEHISPYIPITFFIILILICALNLINRRINRGICNIRNDYLINIYSV